MKYIKYILFFIIIPLTGIGQVNHKTLLPSSFPGLVLWLGDSVDVVGGNVSQWYDLSGNNYNAKQLSAVNQPLHILNSDPLVNNQSVLRFDGTNDYFTIGDSLDPLKKDLNIFLVAKSNSILSVYVSKDQYQYVNGSYALWYASDKLRFKYTDGASKEAASVEKSGQYELISAITNRDAGVNNLYKGGTNIATRTTIPDKTVGIDNSFHFMVGATVSSTMSPVFFLNGDIAEILIYDTLLTDSSRLLVEQYLRDKYAPPVSLGSDITIPYGFCDTVIDASNRFVNYSWSTTDTISSITISENGTYFVQTTDVFGYVSSDTIEVIYPKTIENYIADTTLCVGDTLVLNSLLNKSAYSFIWSDNSTDSILKVSIPGNYWVRVTDSLGCFQYSDTITISIDSFPTQTSLGIDKQVCQFSNLGLETGTGGVNYLWSSGDTTIQTMVDTAGAYWVQVENINGCLAKDTINISLNGIAPTVDFEVVNVCENTTTTLNSTSFTTDGSNIISWYWDLGTGDTSITETTQYLYADGVYNIVLEVVTDSGCTNKYQEQITIHQKPTAGFFPSTSLMCSNINTVFTNNSFSSDGVLDSWFWDFGIAGVSDTSTLEDGSYIYSNGGSFNVQLISTTQYGCSDTVSQFISVKQSPLASFNIQDSCVNNAIAFTNSSSGNLSSILWDFGDFNSSSLTNPSHTYADSGLFNIKLIIRDLNGCWDTLVQPISIKDSPQANFVVNDFCALSSVQLYDSSYSSGALTLWDWNILNTSYSSNSQNPQFNFPLTDTGSYNLKLWVQNEFGCVDSVINQINVHPLPLPDFSFTPSIGLPPLQVSFTNNSIGSSVNFWDFGDGNNSSQANPLYTYIDSNTFEIKLITTSAFGCVDSVSKYIQVIEPVVDVAVRNITYQILPNSDLMKVTVQIENKGVVTVSSMELMFYNSSTGKVLELWQGEILPATQELIELSSIVELPKGEIPDVICLEALNPNNEIDINMTDNELCKSLKKFELINIYPIPTFNDLYLDLIVPETNPVEVNLYNDLGKSIGSIYKAEAIKGLNRIKLNMSVYANGIYIIELKFKEETIRKKLMIN